MGAKVFSTLLPSTKSFIIDGCEVKARRQEIGYSLLVPAGYSESLLKLNAFQTLNDNMLCAIEVSTIDNLTCDDEGNPTINNDAFKQAFLLLKYNKCNVVDKIPLYQFNVPTMFGSFFMIDDLVIEWSQSGVWFGDTSNIAATVESIYFTFHYWELYGKG